MQQVRGFIWFEDKEFDDVKSVFDGFSLDSVELTFFKSLTMDDSKISQPGVFITGRVDDRYSSKDVVNLFRERVGLEKGLKGCDVSIESEDTMKSLARGNLKGNYIGIRIEPPYDLERVYALASRIADSIKAHDVFVRTVESRDDKPLVCIDLITQQEPEITGNETEQLVSSDGLKTGKLALISLTGP